MPSLGKELYKLASDPAELGSLVGSALGAVPVLGGSALGYAMSPKGHRLHGLGMGTLKGHGTGTGMSLGAGAGFLGGALGGAGLGALAGDPMMGAAIGGMGGTLAGMPVGAYKGFKLSDKYLPAVRRPVEDYNDPLGYAKKDKEKNKTTEKKEPEKKDKKDKE